MLKRFLQLFRNQEVPSAEMDHPHCGEWESEEGEETTYLDFLFSSIQPRVEQRLRDHPTTDPILEIATQILVEMFPNHWEEPEGALRDQFSPKTEIAPPPPPAGAAPQGPPAPPGATQEPGDDDADNLGTGEEEVAEEVETNDDEPPEPKEASSEELDETENDDHTVQPEDDDKEEAVGEGNAEQDTEEDDEAKPHKEVSEDSPTDDEESDVEPEESDGEPDEDVVVEGDEVVAEDDSEVVDDSEDEEVDKVYDTDALEAIEEQSADVDAAPPAGFVSALDDTAEFEPPPVRRGVEEESVWPTALDSPSVLRGSRVLLAVLIDNDRLPVDEQLEVGEMLLAADLWIHLMAQATDLDERAQNLARLVEQKFETNHFSQARLLLQLFPSNLNTRIKHDRQLFYEDMILRLGVRRGQPMDSVADGSLGEHLRSLELSDDDSLRRSFEELAQEAGIRMHVYTREPEEVEKWRQLAELCPWPDASSYVLAKLPPRRWRESYLPRERSIYTSLQEHIVLPMARDHVIAHIKACYFVLRAVGDTGLEPYLDCFFDWSESFCDVNATTYLSQLHQRVQGNREMIEDVFSSIYDEHYREPIANALEGLDSDSLEQSFAEAMEHLAAADFAEVAGGNFNLGAFVLDAFLEIEHPSPEFSFKLHRLT